MSQEFDFFVFVSACEEYEGGCVCQDGNVWRFDVKRRYLHSIHRMQPFCVFSFVFLKMKHYFYTNINIYCT